MQRTSLRYARSPLTPTVRRGCAAQSSALTVHCLQQPSREPARPRLNVAGSQRRPSTSRAPFVVRQVPRRSRVFCRRIHPRSTPTTARPLRLAVPRAVAAWASRSRRRVRAPHLWQNPLMRRRRDTPRDSQCPASQHSGRPAKHRPSALLRSRPGAFPRSSVSPAFLSPPRFHSATPNPACSGLAQLRCARH